MIGPQFISDILPLLFPLLYVVGLWATGRLTGWHSLAKRFPRLKDPGPRLGRLLWGSLQIGRFGKYNHCVIWSAHEKALCISPWFYLRMGHAPIHLPWEGLHFTHRSRFWLLDGVDVITSEGDKIWLPIAQAKDLRKSSQGKFWPKTTHKP
jgi:hypothetical protein